MIDAANLAWGNYPLLSHGATEALKHHGEDWQKEVFLRAIVDGRWTGTMCLTEPHCGSDLGLLKTRAEPQADGSYAITGTKIFRSEEHTSELQSLMRISYAVFCLKNKKNISTITQKHLRAHIH